MNVSGEDECNEFGLFTFLERGRTWRQNIFVVIECTVCCITKLTVLFRSFNVYFLFVFSEYAVPYYYRSKSAKTSIPARWDRAFLWKTYPT